MASIERRAQLLRDPLETQVLDHTLPLYLYPQTGPLPGQSATSARSVQTH